MSAKQDFDIKETHRVLQQFGADVEASSEDLGWSSAFVSIQRERPFAGRFDGVANSLIVMPRKGPADMIYRLDGRIVSRQVQSGGVFFLPAERACDVTSRSVLDTVHVYLHADLFSDREDEVRVHATGLSPMLGDPDPIIEHLVAAMAELVNANQSASSLLADSIASAMANRLLALNRRDNHLPRASRAYRLSQRKIQEIREFVEANIGTDLKLSALAALCGVSNDYFQRLFKSTVGVSPHQYVLALRVGLAKELLGDPSRGLSDIAVQCGFAHQQHFTSTFRRFTGVTPGAYRRR